MSKFDKIKYNNEYNRKNYDRIALALPKGDRDTIRAHVTARGESLNAFMHRAAAAQIERDRAEDERRAAEPPTITPAEALAPTPAEPEALTQSENPEALTTSPTPERSEPSRPHAEQRAGQRTEDAAQAPAEISTTPTDNKPTTSKPRRGRRPKQTEQDPAQLTLDDGTTGSGSGDE